MANVGRSAQSGERGPRLSRDLIVDLAVALADAEGLAAVSMGRLGRELNVTPMSLYRYVESKQDLTTMMAERVLDDLDLPDRVPAGESWDVMARRVIYAWSDLITRHPGSARTIYANRPVTSKDMLPAELFASAALQAGFTPQSAALAYRTIVLFVDSVLLSTGTATGSGTTDWQSLPAEISGSLPAMRRIAPYVDRLTYREIFDRGVDILLAGLEQRLQAGGWSAE